MDNILHPEAQLVPRYAEWPWVVGLAVNPRMGEIYWRLQHLRVTVTAESLALNGMLD